MLRVCAGRYGLGLRTLNTLMERVVANFTALYDIIESGNPFEDVEEVCTLRFVANFAGFSSGIHSSICESEY